MQPFSLASVKIVILLIILSIGFYFWEFPFYPFINIALKSMIIGVLYFSLIYKLNVSEDITSQIKKYLRLK